VPTVIPASRIAVLAAATSRSRILGAHSVGFVQMEPLDHRMVPGAISSLGPGDWSSLIQTGCRAALKSHRGKPEVDATQQAASTVLPARAGTSWQPELTPPG
jgi:hypothetical protein